MKRKKTIVLITALAICGIGCQKTSPLPTVVQQTSTISESEMPPTPATQKVHDTSVEGSAPLGATPAAVTVIPLQTTTQGAVVMITE